MAVDAAGTGRVPEESVGNMIAAVEILGPATEVVETDIVPVETVTVVDVTTTAAMDTLTESAVRDEMAMAATVTEEDVDRSVAKSAGGPHFSSLLSTYFIQYTFASASQMLVFHHAIVADGNPENRTNRERCFGNNRYWSYCAVPVGAG